MENKDTTKPTTLRNNKSCILIFLFAFFLTVALQLDDGPYRIFASAIGGAAAGWFIGTNIIKSAIIGSAAFAGLMTIGYIAYHVGQ